MLERVLAEADRGLPDSIERLRQLLRIESISTDPRYARECHRAAEWIAHELAGIGFAASVRETPGHPFVIGHQPVAGRPTALFYAHYDVQPADPPGEWKTPPFEPVIETLSDGRKVIVARGASDDKGQLMTFVEAARAWHAVTGSIPVGVTVCLEGEEESGSPNLRPFLERHAAELNADVAMICDTGMWSRERPAITISLRGLVGEEVTVFAADRDLHSGMFGGAARNPIQLLSTILASLHDSEGRVTIPGFYEGVPEVSAEVMAQWRTLGFEEDNFLGEIGLSIPAGERGRTVLEKIWARPTAEVNGIFGGYTGDGFKTVIPAHATAKISFRLVGDQDPSKVREAFRAFVSKQIPGDCRVEFTSFGASGAVHLPADGPWMQRARGALAEEWGAEPALVGSGGSIPVAGDFKQVLGLSPLMIGFALDDDRIHSPNEKYDVESYHRGIRSWVRILAAFAD